VSTPTETLEEFTTAFKAAWPDGDAARVSLLLSEDAVCHKGPMAPLEGVEQSRRQGER
jgi:ketosteroid isomerase-like protein